MKYCFNSQCPGRRQNDKPAGYHDSLEVCPECGASLSENDSPVHALSPSPWRELFISFGVFALCVAARQIPLPTATPTAELGYESPAHFSIMALGVRPLLLGYMLVEFAALLVPAWRPLRVGSPGGRARLHRAALIVGMLLAAGQAVFFTTWLESLGVAMNYGAGFRLITVVTLLGATGALIALAGIVDREGLGSGFSILLLVDLVPQIVGPLGNACSGAESTAIPWSVPLNGIFVTAVVAGAALWMFSPFCLPDSRGYPHPSLISRPACGMVPLAFVAGTLAFATAWARIKNQSQTETPLPSVSLPAALLLSIGAALLFAFLFNRPSRIAAIWNSLSPNPPGGIPRLKAVILESVVFSVFVVLVDVWSGQRLGGYAPHVGAVLLVTGIICDLMREWRARTKEPHLAPVWEIHQTYAVAPAMRLLEAEGIRAFAKGARLRNLLQFFGPYVPIRIMVSEADAQRAHTLLQARWPGGGGERQ